MKQMSAAEFKAKCLAVMDRVRATGEPVVVTKRGNPVVRVAPAPVAGRSPLGSLAGTFEITGDIVGPASDLSDWTVPRKARPGTRRGKARSHKGSRRAHSPLAPRLGARAASPPRPAPLPRPGGKLR